MASGRFIKTPSLSRGCFSGAFQQEMALPPSAGGIERRFLRRHDVGIPRERLLSFRKATSCPRSFTTSCTMRTGESAWYSYSGFISRKWSGGLQTLKQLVGVLVRTSDKKEMIRIRYLELKASTSQEVETSGEIAYKKGILVEFMKDSKSVCAVLDRPEGKKSWFAIDKYGNTHSVRPGKGVLVIPGAENFKASDIPSFLEKVEGAQDMSLLEIAWDELAAADKPMDLFSLAKLLFGDVTHVEYYATHCMLASKQPYFRRKQKGSIVLYEPRPSSEVEILQRQYDAEEIARKEVISFSNVIKTAIDQPHGSKPSKDSWYEDAYSASRTRALWNYALEMAAVESQRTMAQEVLDALGRSRTPESALSVLMGMGVLPLHANVGLLKSGIPVEFSEEQLTAAKLLEEQPCVDQNLDDRMDLTSMKVYTIDSDSTKEIDDGLSAKKLPDGRINVWIHIADPTRWVEIDHILEREARERGTTVYLPEKTIPMFPLNLAAGAMSLRDSSDCCAISVSVTLNEDGSIAESSVVCSTIKPSMRLSYEDATELVMLRLDEEPELTLLARAAELRHRWRRSQGAMDTNFAPTVEVKVTDPDSIEPKIELHVVDMGSPSGKIVTEMMILCGEAVSAFGNEHSLPLPYRGQSDMMAASMTFSRPVPHSGLGVPGYVQFTSPIRRYTDLLAHYQVKAVLCDKAPPFTPEQLEFGSSLASSRIKEVKKLSSASTRYWLLEYVRRRPKDEVFEATVRNIKSGGDAVIYLNEVGLFATIRTSLNVAIDDTVRVSVLKANPRKDILEVKLVEVVETEQALNNAMTA